MRPRFCALNKQSAGKSYTISFSCPWFLFATLKLVSIISGRTLLLLFRFLYLSSRLANALTVTLSFPFVLLFVSIYHFFIYIFIQILHSLALMKRACMLCVCDQDESEWRAQTFAQGIVLETYTIKCNIYIFMFHNWIKSCSEWAKIKWMRWTSQLKRQCNFSNNKNLNAHLFGKMLLIKWK